jgi:hypothetical protein
MLRKLGAEVRAGGVPIEQAVSSLYCIFLIGKTPLATLVYRGVAAGAHYAVAFFDPRQQPKPGAWIKEKCGELVERLHFLWQRGEIEPMAGAGTLGVVDRLIRILRPRYTLSADYKQHPTYTGTGRPGRYTLSKDPRALVAYDGSPGAGGVTTPHVDAHSVLPLELRMYALGLHDAGR